METPTCEPQKLTLVCEMAPMRIWSYARDKKQANVLAKATVRSRVAQPIATPTRFCSAMKHSTKRSGYASCATQAAHWSDECETYRYLIVSEH